MNNHPSLQSQFLAALLAFTSLFYGNVWLMTRAPAAAPQAEYAEAPTVPDLANWSREEIGDYIVAEAERQLNDPANYLAAAANSYTTAGTPVPPGGLIWSQTSSRANPDEAYGIAVDSMGVYIVGSDQSLVNGNLQWRIEKRSLTDGSLIWFQTSNPSASWDVAKAVAVDSTGVYVAGDDFSQGMSNGQWRIEKRSLTDGSLIWTQTTNPSFWTDAVLGVAVDGAGVYIVGMDMSPGYGNDQWRIEKRGLTDGSLIWSQTSNPSGEFDVANGVSVDNTGVYIVGYESFHRPGGGIYSQWRMEKRSLTDGSLIWIQTSNPSEWNDIAYGVAVDSTGVYVVGDDSSINGIDFQWRIEKRNLSNGGLIFSQTSNPSSYNDQARGGVTVDSTGVYIVGYDSSPGQFDSQWRIEKRRLGDGSLIWAQQSNPSGGGDWTNGVAVESTGIYVAGRDSQNGWNYQWRIEKRANPDVARLTISGTPRINSRITLNLNDALNPSRQYILAMAFGTAPGLPLGDRRVIPLNQDGLFSLSTANPLLIGLQGGSAALNAQGQATATWDIPNITGLAGITVYLAFTTYDPLLPLPQTITSISPAVPVTLMQ